MDILNRHHLPPTHWPPGARYVGRGTALGNPFQIGRDGTREEVIKRYAIWLDDAVNRRDPAVLTALLGLDQTSSLVCSCAPRPCHAEVIRDIWERRIAPGIPIERKSGYAYAGIGSRRTPPAILDRIRRAARRLAEYGIMCRTGGATGADTAFREGASPFAEVFLPFPGFNGLDQHIADVRLARPTSDAARIAQEVHPAWQRLSKTAQILMARNSHQILGAELDSPVDFVLCWTPDGAESEAQRTRTTGGTGQAISLADRWGAPVFNMRHPDALDRLAQWLDEHVEAPRQNGAPAPHT